MQVKEVKKRGTWESFVQGFEQKTFVQSWNWAKFQKKMGKKVWRLGVFKKGRVLGVALVFKEEAKRGNYLVLPHGPLIVKSKCKDQNAKCKMQSFDFTQDKKSKWRRKGEIFNALIKAIRKIGKKEGVCFIRVAPIWKRTEQNKKIFKEAGFRRAPIHIHPEVTWQLDLRPSEQDIVMEMRKNTRYYVRKAKENKEIEVEKSEKRKDLDVFYRLYQKTAERHHFVPFSREYVRKELEAFLPEGEALIFLGKYNGEVVVASIVIFWQEIAFYHQGASKRVKPPVSYGVQWEIIKEAKRRGCETYNFWGIADIDLSKQESKNHPWWGLTLFKKGFGGEAVRYVKTRDLVLSPFYAVNYLVEYIRSKRRGFG